MSGAGGSGIPYAKTDKPLEVDSPNSSKNSALRAATAVQSSVRPEDYPEAERKLQVAAATGAKPRRTSETKPE